MEGNLTVHSNDGATAGQQALETQSCLPSQRVHLRRSLGRLQVSEDASGLATLPYHLRRSGCTGLFARFDSKF